MQSRSVVHVVDDDAAMRESLSFLLESAGYDAKVYGEASHFLKSLSPSLTGCVVTDIRMPEMDGLELLRRIKKEKKTLPVIVMTGHGDVPLAVEAMKLGASDFIEKPFDDETLLNALRNAESTDGEAPSAEVQEFNRRLGSLTERERQVFDRLVLGEANKVIGRNLDISPRTVEIYRAKVMTKMQTISVSALVRAAVRAGAA